MFREIARTFLKFFKKCKLDNISAYAAQAAFFIIMAAIPFLIALVSLLQFLPISQDEFLELLYQAMPGYIEPLIKSVVNEIYSSSVGILPFSILLALWASGKALHNMSRGLNHVNGITESRSWFAVRLWSTLYTILMILVIFIMLVVLVFNEYIRDILEQLFGITGVVLAFVGVRPLFRDAVIIVIMILMFVWFYTVLPDKKVIPGSQIPGAIICALSWYVFSLFLSLYVNIYSQISIYGSLSTLLLMMFWLYACMYIMMVCAEINVFFEDFLSRFMEKRMRRRKAKRKKRLKKMKEE